MGSFLSRASRSRSALKNKKTVNIQRPPVSEQTKASIEERRVHQRDEELLDRLKDVYVSSTTNLVSQENPYGASRPDSKLPQERRGTDRDNFDITVASEGYLSVKQLMDIFEHRRRSEDKWTPSRVAAAFKIDEKAAENLLKHFNTYKTVATYRRPKPDMKFHNLHE